MPPKLPKARQLMSVMSALAPVENTTKPQPLQSDAVQLLSHTVAFAVVEKTRTPSLDDAVDLVARQAVSGSVGLDRQTRRRRRGRQRQEHRRYQRNSTPGTS